MQQPRPLLIVLLLVVVLLGSTASAQTLRWVATSGYVSSYGAHVIGVLINEGSAPVEYVRIVSSIYDSDDGFLDSDFTYTMLDTLNPGEWSPFTLAIRGVDRFATYDYQAEWSATTAAARPVVIDSHRGAMDGRFYRVTGQVVNRGNRPQEYVKIVGAAYDRDGELVAVDFTYTRLDTVSAGARAPFELNFGDLLGTVARYDLIVQSSDLR